MWRNEHVPLLLKYLDVRSGQRVVDVGCGTGFFTRLIARGLRGKGEAIGVDRNRRLLRLARRITERESVSDIVSFRFGTAESLPMRDDEADRVVCQTLLWILRDVRTALREMIRVCKPGGMVGAVEGAFDHVLWYAPDDPRLTELYRKWVLAQTEGYRKLYGNDRGIGYKLPSIFKELGLRRVRVDAYPYVWTESDDRVPRAFKLQAHRDYLRRVNQPHSKERKESTRILIAGGMARDEIEEMRRIANERSRRILKNPSLLDDDFSMNAGLFFIATGVKD